MHPAHSGYSRSPDARSFRPKRGILVFACMLIALGFSSLGQAAGRFVIVKHGIWVV